MTAMMRSRARRVSGGRQCQSSVSFKAAVTICRDSTVRHEGNFRPPARPEMSAARNRPRLTGLCATPCKEPAWIEGHGMNAAMATLGVPLAARTSTASGRSLAQAPSRGARWCWKPKPRCGRRRSAQTPADVGLARSVESVMSWLSLFPGEVAPGLCASYQGTW